MGETKFPGTIRSQANSSVPTFAVHFESPDDFLVEYTDALRLGRIELPLPQPLAPRTAVRVRLELPDSAVLYLTGTAGEVIVGTGATQIRLHALSSAQQRALEGCVETLLGARSEDAELQAPQVLNVLLVDDLVSQRIELGDALRASGLLVRAAENGLLALSSALKKVPDVILTDVEMPQMDGWTLLRSLRRRKRLLHVPVVFLTKLSDELSRLRGYRMGADDFLPKSMDVQEIIARLYGAVARRRQLPELSAAHGLRGDLEHVRLGSLLAFLESERRTGALRLHNGSDNATLRLTSGALAGVENLGRYDHPHDRVFELLSWSFGQFEFLAEAVPAAEQPANAAQTTPVAYLLMEHARREDEAKPRD